MMNTYLAGNIVVVQDTLTDPVTNEAMVPTAISLKVKDAAGTVTTHNAGFANPSPGVYTFEIDTTGGAPGVWCYEWISTGTAQALTAGEFVVETPPI
jgi:hypothetical protein